MSVPRQRNTKEENETIKAGKTPEEWEQQPAKNAQKDKDARWTKKSDASFFGYKNHLGVDKAHKLIRKWDATDAAVHDSLGKPSAAVEPSKGAFDDPTAWKHHESFRPIRALDDFSFELRQDLRQGLLKVRPLVATIGKEPFQERVHPEKGRKKQDAATCMGHRNGDRDCEPAQLTGCLPGPRVERGVGHR